VTPLSLRHKARGHHETIITLFAQEGRGKSRMHALMFRRIARTRHRTIRVSPRLCHFMARAHLFGLWSRNHQASWRWRARAPAVLPFPRGIPENALLCRSAMNLAADTHWSSSFALLSPLARPREPLVRNSLPLRYVSFLYILHLFDFYLSRSEFLISQTDSFDSA